MLFDESTKENEDFLAPADDDQVQTFYDRFLFIIQADHKYPGGKVGIRRVFIYTPFPGEFILRL